MNTDADGDIIGLPHGISNYCMLYRSSQDQTPVRSGSITALSNEPHMGERNKNWEEQEKKKITVLFEKQGTRAKKKNNKGIFQKKMLGLILATNHEYEAQWEMLWGVRGTHMGLNCVARI